MIPKIMQIAHKGSGGQRGYIHYIEGVVGACAATDYKDPKLILEPILTGGTNWLTRKKYRVRKLTPTEYGRLQGFPMDDWKQVVSNTQAYKQFGNAVTVSVSRTIANAIADFLTAAKGVTT